MSDFQRMNTNAFSRSGASAASGEEINLATLMLASAMAVGGNLADVRNGDCSVAYAVVNGLAKGTAASIILSGPKPDSPLEVAGTIGMLAGTGYLIDSVMKSCNRSSANSSTVSA